MKASFDLEKRDLEAFHAACALEGKSTDAVVAALLREYTGKALAKAAGEYSEPTFDEAKYHAKAIKRIPKWAGHPEQYNHKIIAAYYYAIKLDGRATLPRMRELCSDSMRPELHVPSFNTNYSQMKLDNPKSHGKVFVDDGFLVTIWDEVKPKLDEFVEYFAVELDETAVSGKEQ